MQKNMDFKEVCRDLRCYKVFISEGNMALTDC